MNTYWIKYSSRDHSFFISQIELKGAQGVLNPNTLKNKTHNKQREKNKRKNSVHKN